MDVVPSSCTSDKVRGTGGGTVGHPVGRVDVPGLARVGSTVEQMSASFGQAYTAHADGLAAGDAAAGWASGAALPGAAERWATFVRGLAADVKAFGAGLAASAQAYQRTDDAAADRILNAAGPGAGTPAGHPAWGHPPR